MTPERKLVTRFWGLVALMLIAVALGHISQAKAADLDVQIGVGTSVINVTQSVSEIVAIQYNREWEVQGVAVGEGFRNTPSRSHVPAWSAYTLGRVHYFREGKTARPYLKLGIAVLHNAPPGLLGCDFMYNLGFGVELHGAYTLAWDHISSAGRCDPNTGYDTISLRTRWSLR